MSPAQLRRELARAEAASAKASEARAALPAGSTRARVTSANARWARAAEHRDLLARQLREAENAARVPCPRCGVLAPPAGCQGCHDAILRDAQAFLEEQRR